MHILIWISEETDCDMSHNVRISDLLLPQKQSIWFRHQLSPDDVCTRFTEL